MAKLPDNSIDLVITSPPYWSIKDYGNNNQLGYNDSLNEYMKKLTQIFSNCIQKIKPNSKLCINIGDQFLRASTPPKKVYHIIPLHSMIINRIIEANPNIVYIGSISWKKVSHSQTSGGGQIMGSYPFPKSGYFFVNREYIAIFRKLGNERKYKPSTESKRMSRMTLDEWREYFKDTWKFSPADQKTHPAMFPEELPKRLIKMYSYVGDTVLDPFLGSGTTMAVASTLARNSIGYEIGFKPKDDSDWKTIIKDKVTKPKIQFEYPLESNQEKVERIEKERILVKNKYLWN